MLHVTNGDSVIESFKAGQVPGVYLAWRDPLHDGPVPETSSLEELSDVRARALSDFGWGSYSQIRQQFSKRDRTLAGFREHDETVLWFEHDLYDQLQLIQLLDWFSGQDLGSTRLSLVQVGEYPETTVRPRPDPTPTFNGLGELTGEQLARLLPARVPITARHFELGRAAWRAVRATDPGSLLEIARGVDAALPFLGAALHRFLEEYPSPRNGLSRTEQQLLVAAALGARQRQALYLQTQSFESCPWGDASVFLRLKGLAAGPNPALTPVSADEFALNDHGKRLLAGDDDWVRSSGGLDRWIGGVHLVGEDVRWRWSDGRRTLTGLED